MKERWVAAKGFPRYNVSNLGGVIDLKTVKLVKQSFVKGRFRVYLWDEIGIVKVIEVHRLVATSFFEVEVSDFEVKHSDGDLTNNAVWNLEIISSEENKERSYNSNVIKRPTRVLNLDTNETYFSLREASRRLGLVSSIVIPKRAREHGEEFVIRGFRLKLV